MRDPLTCKLATVGKPRGDTGFVDVNRPLQQRNKDHELKYCDSGDFSEYFGLVLNITYSHLAYLLSDEFRSKGVLYDSKRQLLLVSVDRRMPGRMRN